MFERCLSSFTGFKRRTSRVGDLTQFTKQQLSSHSFKLAGEMNQALFLLIFCSGAFMAMFLGGLFGDYFKACLKTRSSDRTWYLPQDSYIQLLEQSTLVPTSQTELNTVNNDKEVEHQDKSSLAEALNSVNMAFEMKKQFKFDKAARLFKHAMALAPRSPDVLNSYGEFLEESRKDLVEADHLFALALAFSSNNTDTHSRALANRKRTALRVEELDRAVLRNIEAKKLMFLDIAENSAAMKRAKKEAYFQYVYHTVGIEGNTMSLGETRSILETKLAVAGKSIMEHNEILGMDSALKFVNQTLVDKIGDITLQDILEIHKRVIGHVDPTEAGIFRTTQVYVGDHVPPPPSLVEILVARFVLWLNSLEALSLHPVRLAALAHYKLVYIHPFIDGNGRTSRLLMNLVLMQTGYPPVIIRRSDREIYYKYLNIANQGDIRPFVRFIAHCTEKTLDAYLWASREYRTNDQTELDADLPPNLIEHGIDQVKQIRYGNVPPKDSFLDFSSSSERIITGEDYQETIIPQTNRHQDNVIRN